MNELNEKVKAAVVDFLDVIIKHGTGGRAPFRVLFTVFIDDKPTPVLAVGSVDGNVEDGDAYAILNPDPDLLDRFKAGVGYSATVKEAVAGKCDGMVHVWLEAYVTGLDRAKTLASYTPRSIVGEPKFKVQ